MMSESTTAYLRSASSRYPLLALGFRPFYLVAVLFAGLALPLWLAMVIGGIELDTYLVGLHWHSHEMVFGFTSAVIAGFLLTAVRNWTGQPTPAGTGLAALVVVWISGRFFLLTGPAAIAIIADLAFLPTLAAVIAIPIWRSRNTRNYKLLLVLAGLTIGNLLFHLANMNIIPGAWFRISTTAALDLITILMAIVGGRVIPAFTANAVPSATPKQLLVIEVIAIATLVTILLFGIIDVWVSIPTLAWAALLATAALAHTVRWLLWQPHRTLGNALLWMLPIAYVWIPISLGLRVLSTLSFVPPAAPVHALTLGAIGALMLSMMMRSALGHTGRALRAGFAEIAAFLLMQLAAVVRVTGSVIDAGFYRIAIVVSGILWTLSFVVFLLRYAPILTQLRIDGRPG